MSVQNDGYLGQMDVLTQLNLFNALKFLVKQVANENWTITLVKVITVQGGGVDVPPTVDVQPLVNEVDGYGNQTEHGTIYGLPVFRLQGGVSAFIMDPLAGDIGVMACASRDISSVVTNQAPSSPGSLRTFDPADGIYFGGLLGQSAPTNYIQLTQNALNIQIGSVALVIDGSTVKVTIGAQVVTFSSTGLNINGIDFATHYHFVAGTPGNSGPAL